MMMAAELIGEIIAISVVRRASAEILPTLKQILLNLHHLAPESSLNAKTALNSEPGLKASKAAREQRGRRSWLCGVVSLRAKAITLEGIISLG